MPPPRAQLALRIAQLFDLRLASLQHCGPEQPAHLVSCAEALLGQGKQGYTTAVGLLMQFEVRA